MKRSDRVFTFAALSACLLGEVSCTLRTINVEPVDNRSVDAGHASNFTPEMKPTPEDGGAGSALAPSGKPSAAPLEDASAAVSSQVSVPVVDAAVSRDPEDAATLVEPGQTTLLDTPLGETGLSVRDVVGFYSGDWGDMLLQPVGDEVWGTYVYDQGTVVLRVEGGAMVGWWSEVPSRMPSGDAGRVEFRWQRTALGVIHLDGRWMYGAEQATWSENWDLDLVTGREAPVELVQRFSDPSLFHRM